MQFKFHSQDDLTTAQDLVERAGVRIYTSWGNVGPATMERANRPLSRQDTDFRPSSAISNNTPGVLSSLTSATFPGSEYPSSPPHPRQTALRNSMRDDLSQFQTRDDYQQSSFPAGSRAEQRPSTAPNFTSDRPLSAMMPPRRELPFTRPYYRDSDKTFVPGDGFIGSPAVNKQASSSDQRPSTADLAPLKTPTYATRSTTRMEKKKQVANSSLTHNDAPPTSEYFPALRGLSPSTLRDETSRPVLSPLKRPLSDTDSNENSRSTRRPFSNGRASSSTHKTHTDDSENYIVEQVRNATHSDGSRTLRSYAAQTQEMRDSLLNELFIECIEDDGFIALCQDVAANWRRIGLGLQ